MAPGKEISASGSEVRSLARIYVGDVLPAHAARIAGESTVLAMAGIEHSMLVIGRTRPPRIPDSWRGGCVEERVAPGLFSMARILRQWVRSRGPSIVHAHGLWAALLSGIALRFMRNRPLLVYEVHGALAFESSARHAGVHGKLRFLALYCLENVAVLTADRLLLVSEEIRRYYPAMSWVRSAAIPRAVEGGAGGEETARSMELEEVLRFADRSHAAGRPVVVYSGGLASWQRVDETLALLARCLSFDLSALVLTYDLEGLTPALPEELLESSWFHAASLSRSEVSSALRVCDVGVLLRDDSVVNRVASPTKAFEYLAAGLHIVTTEGAAGVAGLIKEHGAGVVLELERASEAAPAWIMAADRSPREVARLRDLAQSRFTWAALRGDLLSLYD